MITMATTGADARCNRRRKALSMELPLRLLLRSPMTPSPWKICLCCGSFLLASVARGAPDNDPPSAVTPATDANAPPAVHAATNGDQGTIPRIPGLFEIDLPVTERRGAVKFIFQPHFRDFISKDYLRVPLEFRWGVNDHFELNSVTDAYFDHGLRHSHNGQGLSSLHFGAKYAWHEWLKPTWSTSVGFNSSIPVSRPPRELTDGHNHFTPYIVFGRKLNWLQGLSGFVHASVDLLSKSSTPGNFGRNQPHSNSMTLTPGFLYDRKAWHYTLEVDGTTTRVLGKGDKDFLTIRPGVVWDLPKKLVFNARGRWLAGFNITAVFGPDGNTLSTGGRFQGEVSLRRPFLRDRHENHSTDNPPAEH